MEKIDDDWGYPHDSGHLHMGVSVNGATPKWMVSNGKSH